MQNPLQHKMQVFHLLINVIYNIAIEAKHLNKEGNVELNNNE